MNEKRGGFLPRQAYPWLYWVCPVLLLTLFLWHTWQDPDIWYHLAMGRGVFQHLNAQPPGNLILRQDNATNIYWLFQLTAWAFYRSAGAAGVTFMFLAAWLLAFALWAGTAAFLARPLLGLPVAVAALVVCFPRFLERPEVFTYLFLAVQLYWLTRAETGQGMSRIKLAGFVLVQVLWANTHGYFFLGPLAAAIWFLAAPLRPIASPRRRQAGLLLALLLIAGAASPFGIGTWRTVYGQGSYLAAMRNQVVEFAPYALGGHPSPPELFFWAWAGTVAALAAAVLIARRRLFEPALAVAGLGFALYSRRNAPLAVFLSAPLWGTAVTAWETRLLSRLIPRVTARLLALALTALCLVFAGKVALTGSYQPVSGNKSLGLKPSPMRHPEGVLRYLKGTGFNGSIFNHPSDGSYLEFHMPSLRLYGDSRFTDVEKTREYFLALADPQQFLRLHALHNFDAVLINLKEEQTALMWLAVMPDAWDIVYADLYRCLLVNRRSPAGAGAPYGEFNLYAGEDLYDFVNGSCAVRWMNALTQLGRSDLILLALKQFSQAPRVPPSIINGARYYGETVKDREIVELASSLSARSVSRPSIEAGGMNRAP